MTGGADHPAAETARLFIGVMAPPEVIPALHAARPALEAAGAPPLRWVRPEQVHLTLCFLGETPRTRWPDIAAVMVGAGTATPAHTLTLGALGIFGGQRARVLWVGLEGDTRAVEGLAQALTQGLTALGVALDPRAFRPHLTLARAPARTTPAEQERLRRALAAYTPPPLPFPIAEFQLVESTPQPDGPRYRTLAISACQP